MTGTGTDSSGSTDTEDAYPLVCAALDTLTSCLSNPVFFLSAFDLLYTGSGSMPEKHVPVYRSTAAKFITMLSSHQTTYILDTFAAHCSDVIVSGPTRR